MLETQINDAFLAAYKTKDSQTVATLRMIKAAILNKKIESRLAKEDILPDAEVIGVLKNEVKKRADAAESYKAGGRTESAEQELREAELIKKFLPAQMSEEKVLELVRQVIAEQGNPGPAGFGKIMGAVVKAAAGAADGALVSKLVKEELAK